MYCPECKLEQHCPCRGCATLESDKITWVWDETGELISCGGCGVTEHADWWLNEEGKQREQQE